MNMENNLDYLAGQLLSLVFYIITLVIYNRARKEYSGGKIAAAIKLVMGFLCIRLLADSVDYFAGMLLPINADTVLIIKIVLNLSAMCVLFFGGLRFFVTRSASRAPAPAPVRPVVQKQPTIDPPSQTAGAADGSATVVLEDLTDEPADRPDDRPALGRYEILGQIGKGAMGVVYKGRDPKLQRLTAIKTIRFGDDFDEDQVDEIKKQFNREAELVAKLSHPNIVAIYDVGEDLDLSYLAMEYLAGESLERYTRKTDRLSVGQCIQVLIQVCDALEYAHGQDIVHRDIKPANIMLLKNGVVKVTDFGVARSAVGSQTRTGVVKGTPYYMSPEQAKGEKVTGVSDIFSLGVVFYQLLTGRLPFTGENLSAIMYQTMSVQPESAEKFNQLLDKTILTILNRALEKDKQKRYQSAAKMANHLRLLSRYRGEDEETCSLRAKRLPQIHAKPSQEEGVPVDRPVASRQQKIQTKPPRMPVNRLPEVLPQKTAEAKDRPDKKKTEGARLPSPWRRRIVLALGLCLLISIPSLYLWYQARSTALRGTNLAAYRVEKKPLKATIPASPGKARVRVEDTTTGLLPAAGKDTEPAAANARQAVVASEQKREIDREAVAAAKQKMEQEHLAREAAEKKAQERLVREAAEKRKEQERLARIAEEKRKEQQRQANMAARQRLERERRVREIEQKRIEQARLAEVARQQKLRQSAEIKNIEKMIAAAQAKLANQEYGAAAQEYEKALAVISASEFKSGEQYQKLTNRIASAQQSDAIVYGAKGHVLYKNKWFTPENYEKKLLSEGFVKYKGDFVSYQKLVRVIEDLAVRKVRALLTKKYTGKQIHKKQIDLHALHLRLNTLPQSSYEVIFNWEIWTFNDIANGTCSVEVRYDAEKDEWKTMPARES